MQPPERKKWDKGEWEAKAKEKDRMYAERAKESEAAMKEGKSQLSLVFIVEKAVLISV